MKRAAQPVDHRRLPKESLERFLRDLDIDHLADDTFSFSEDHFVRLTVRDINTRMDNRLLPLFVPSKDGVKLHTIRQKVRVYLLLYPCCVSAWGLRSRKTIRDFISRQGGKHGFVRCGEH